MTAKNLYFTRVGTRHHSTPMTYTQQFYFASTEERDRFLDMLDPERYEHIVDGVARVHTAKSAYEEWSKFDLEINGAYCEE